MATPQAACLSYATKQWRRTQRVSVAVETEAETETETETEAETDTETERHGRRDRADVRADGLCLAEPSVGVFL